MKGEKGFTFVELLIVMAIAAVSLAVFIPAAAGDTMKKAKAVRVGVVIRNVEQAATQYLMTYFPSSGRNILSLNTLVDKGFLDRSDILNNIDLNVNVGAKQYEIKIVYFHDSPDIDEDFLNYIYATLKDTYSNIDIWHRFIFITSTGTRFW